MGDGVDEYVEYGGSRTATWIKGRYTEDDLRYNDRSYMCSNCGYISDYKERFCSNCGRIMNY